MVRRRDMGVIPRISILSIGQRMLKSAICMAILPRGIRQRLCYEYRTDGETLVHILKGENSK